ncbi:hypothetical protein LJC64_04960, partial [Ruminococcaceae bacterium OttesenSCG-928-A11]|nr:hypothetical protein [Ruminococcaceae bacterium OttesenSCG-928-A11]
MGKRLKRGAALLVGLALAMSLAGCNKDGDSSVSDDLSRTPASSEPDVSASAPAEDDSAASNAGEDASEAPVSTAPVPVAVEVAPGTFHQYNEDRYTDDRAPYLELAADGTAVFRLNSGMGQVGNATGSYTLGGSSLILTIEDLEVSGLFRGSDTATLAFRVLSGDHLQYAGEAYGLSLGGDIFTRVGAGAYDPNA